MENQLEYTGAAEEELDLTALDLLPETESDGLKHLFCCRWFLVTNPTTA